MANIGEETQGATRSLSRPNSTRTVGIAATGQTTAQTAGGTAATSYQASAGQNLSDLQSQYQQRQASFQSAAAQPTQSIASKYLSSALSGLSSTAQSLVNRAASMSGANANAAAADATAATNTAATNPIGATTADQIQSEYAQRQAEAEKLYNQRQSENTNLYNQRQAEANQTYDTRMADANKTYDQRQAEANSTYAQRQKDAQTLYDQRQAEALAQQQQRNAEAQNTYNQRLGESQGKINDLYAKALEAQKLQYQSALDQGIAAQEEARAGIAQTYQTSANDLATQYERNRRNLNMQAMANGLNTGTGSQQQLALNQGYMSSYGKLRGEESAQNAGIDRAIANLKVNYQNQIAQAMADNDYQKAGALMDDYNSKLSWLDAQNMNNQNRYDTLSDQNRSYLDSLNMNNQNYLDSQKESNQNRLDSLTMNNQNRLDTQTDNNQNRMDSLTLNNQNRLDTSSDNNRNWADNEKRYQDTQALQRAETLASYGDFSGYASIYGQDIANDMALMWRAQNPELAAAFDALKNPTTTGLGGLGSDYFDEKTWNANVGRFIYGEPNKTPASNHTTGAWNSWLDQAGRTVANNMSNSTGSSNGLRPSQGKPGK